MSAKGIGWVWCESNHEKKKKNKEVPLILIPFSSLKAIYNTVWILLITVLKEYVKEEKNTKFFKWKW